MAEKTTTSTKQALEKDLSQNTEKQQASVAENKTDTTRTRKPGKPRSEKQKLLAENQQLKERIAHLEEQVLRLTAELHNLKKRHTRELEEVVLYANQKLLEKLLPIVDDLERSLQMSDKNRNFEAFRNGVELIYRNLLKLLESEGVKPVKAVGEKFDYNLHEAVLAVHRDGVEPGVVVEEVQKGYLYKDRVLRHAKVIVSK